MEFEFTVFFLCLFRWPLLANAAYMRRLLARDSATAAAAGCRPCQRHIAHYCFRVLSLNLDEWPKIDPTDVS